MKFYWHPDAPPGQRWQELPWQPPRPRVHLISDYHEPFRCMATGEMRDSKSRYRAEIKARGYEELGNERAECTGRPYEPDSAVNDLRRTAQEYGVSLDGGQA